MISFFSFSFSSSEDEFWFIVFLFKSFSLFWKGSNPVVSLKFSMLLFFFLSKGEENLNDVLSEYKIISFSFSFLLGDDAFVLLPWIFKL